MGDMNFPDPSQSPHESWEWDGVKWAKIMKPGKPEITAIASGVMTTGEMVVLNDDGTVSVVGGSPTNLTDSNYIGVSTGDYSDGSEATVQIAGINADQQGMTIGKQYILPDGSLTTDAGYGEDYEVGTPEVFNNGGTQSTSITYDSVNRKVVIAYRDVGNSSDNYGTAIVGAVSDDSISFGLPVVFNSGSTSEISSDSVNNKVVIAYRDGPNSDYGTVIVGVVSNNSISFGTPVVFNSAFTATTSTLYDPANDKVVISYQDYGNSNRGTAIVGTVSGDSISFGSPVVFNNTGRTDYSSTVYDSVNNKVVIAYRDYLNAEYGTAVVGAVSGDSIVFGAPVVFHGAGKTSQISAAYDPVAEKVVIAYREEGDPEYGTAVVGTVSEDSIGFGAPIVFNNGLTVSTSTTYDPVNNKVVIAYRDGGNSNYGTAIAGEVSGNSISFGTPEVFNSNGTTNYISSTYDPVAEKVVIAHQDGGNSNSGTAVTYGIAAGEPNVFAGTAISSTELNIKDTV